LTRGLSDQLFGSGETRHIRIGARRRQRQPACACVLRALIRESIGVTFGLVDDFAVQERLIADESDPMADQHRYCRGTWTIYETVSSCTTARAVSPEDPGRGCPRNYRSPPGITCRSGLQSQVANVEQRRPRRREPHVIAESSTAIERHTHGV